MDLGLPNLLPPHPPCGHLLPRGEGSETAYPDGFTGFGLRQRIGNATQSHRNDFVKCMVDYRCTRIKTAPAGDIKIFPTQIIRRLCAGGEFTNYPNLGARESAVDATALPAQSMTSWVISGGAGGRWSALPMRVLIWCNSKSNRFLSSMFGLLFRAWGGMIR